MKIAVIDLGSNTFHLVIVESVNHTYQEIVKKRIYARLGEGSLAAAYITSEAQQRALKAMIEFRQLLDVHGVEKIYAVGTSAMRSARNAHELVEAIQKQANIHVEVISGGQEAALIYRGVKEAVKIGKETALIMDIGGGSVEFIICKADKSLWEHSFEIGSQRLVDKFHQHDRILPEDLDSMEQYLGENLKPLFEAVATYKPTRLIGSSGAFTTMASIYRAKENITLDPEATSYDLPFDKFEELYKAILYTTYEERLQTPGLSNQRVDMIVVSAALVHFVVKKTNIHALIASKYSLKEGLFFQALEMLQNQSG